MLEVKVRTELFLFIRCPSWASLKQVLCHFLVEYVALTYDKRELTLAISPYDE